jgi:hypothetical protein
MIIIVNSDIFFLVNLNGKGRVTERVKVKNDQDKISLQIVKIQTSKNGSAIKW